MDFQLRENFLIGFYGNNNVPLTKRSFSGFGKPKPEMELELPKNEEFQPEGQDCQMDEIIIEPEQPQLTEDDNNLRQAGSPSHENCGKKQSRTFENVKKFETIIESTAV